VQPLDGVGRVCRFPLRWRQEKEREEVIPRLFERLGDGSMLETPFGEEKLATN
jgi:hypothetical protein